MNGYSEAALIIVGDELLDGRTRDSNLQAVSRIVASYGLRITESRTVLDSVGAIASALRALSSPGRAIITTGGLGPTDDDLTLQGVSRAASVDLLRNVAAEEMIRSVYLESGRQMPRSALVQADLPAGAEPVVNPVGIAPGVVLTTPSMLVISVPGVPAEAEALLPSCLERAGFIRKHPAGPVLIRTWGIPENSLFDTLSPLASETGTRLAFLPSSGRVDIRVSGDAAAEFTEGAEALLGRAVYGNSPSFSLEEALGELLLNRGWTLSVAESCTGGMLGSAITSVSGSSGWFAGGVISYSNEVKAGLLGVPACLLEEHGAVSRETVLAMVSGVSVLLRTETAIAVSGVAGPDGGTDEKPVGTVWIAVLAGDRTDCSVHRFPGGRAAVRRTAVSCSLGMLLSLLRTGDQ